MAALREHDYDWYDQEHSLNPPSQKQIDHKSQKKLKKQAKFFSNFERLGMALAIVLLVSLAVGCCSYILGRYVQIHTMQYEIFTAKQDLKNLSKHRDELIVTKESFMTLNELESYATDQLNMIKADEGRKVVVEMTESYTTSGLLKMNDTIISNPNKAIDSPLAQLGIWMKKHLTF